MDGSIVAIWNPASGSAPKESDLRDALGPEVKLVETTEDDPGPGQARDAVKTRANILVACGGDGTVRACLEPLAGTDTSLAIVPLGTGNLLASNLGVPSGLKAGQGLTDQPTRTIDLGTVNDESFAVMAGSGFDALMIERANDKAKSRFGTLAYVVSGIKSLREDRVMTTITVDGVKFFKGRTSMVLVGNFGTITGGINVFPDGDPSDGLLDVLAVSARTLRQWFSFAFRMVRQKEPEDLASRAQGRMIVVEHSEPRIYELDGDDRPATNRLEFQVQPDALTVHYRNEIQ